jgi:hypothetical protein
MAAVLALAALGAPACDRAWRSPDPPGEWADAGAVGSGYGLGVARQAHIFQGERTPQTGPPRAEDIRVPPQHPIRAADAGAGDAGVMHGRPSR